MYRKIRCDVRQWKILETFHETKHSLYIFLKEKGQISLAFPDFSR